MPWLSYMGLRRAKVWMPPNNTLEGPIGSGATQPFCTDCYSCNSFLLDCGILKLEYIVDRIFSFFLLRYLSIEFSRDVEFQTSLPTKTSQETVREYLKRSWQNDIDTYLFLNSVKNQEANLFTFF